MRNRYPAIPASKGPRRQHQATVLSLGQSLLADAGLPAPAEGQLAHASPG